MNRIEFRLRVEELGVGAMRTVIPVIDGVSLIELARRVQAGPAARAGEPDLAGSYAGLVAGEDESWQKYYNGEQPETWFDDGDTCVLGCTCGDTGCWPLTTRINISVRRVTWSGFRTGHREWDLSALGPFAFDRSAYDVALENPSRD